MRLGNEVAELRYRRKEDVVPRAQNPGKAEGQDRWRHIEALRTKLQSNAAVSVMFSFTEASVTRQQLQVFGFANQIEFSFI